MIQLTEKLPDRIKMEIKMHLPQTFVFDFLNNKGYEVKAFSIDFPEEDGFLIYEPASKLYTFTATKKDEEQSLENLYLKVFEKEVKDFLKSI